MKYIKCLILGENIFKEYFVLNGEIGQIVLKMPSDLIFLTRV